MRDIGYELQKGLRYLKHYGVREFFLRLREKGEPGQLSYEEFIRQNQLSGEELRRQTMESAKWKSAPLFLCMVSETYAAAAAEQMNRQTYPHWEICAGADWMHLPDSPVERERVERTVSDDKKEERENSYHEKICDRPIWLFSLEEGDLLDPSALYFAAGAILFPDKSRQSGLHWKKVRTPDLIYTDHDEVTSAGVYQNPQMKPDFSPELIEETCYIRYLFLVSRELAERVSDEMALTIPKAVEVDCSRYEEDDQWAVRNHENWFMTICAQRAKMIFHIPRVLYHKFVDQDCDSMHTDSAGVSKLPDVFGHQKKDDEFYSTDGVRRIPEICDDHPLISIIIPNKDEKETLEKCLNALRESTYDHYEIVIVENNSTGKDIFDFYERLSHHPEIKIVTWKSDSGFNYSAINNFGVSCAKGEYLVFLNNDVEILTADWLERLFSDCARPGVGAAGVKLLYPDGTIQHAGIMVGVGGHARGIASNMLVGIPGGEGGYMNRGSLRQNMSAVTAACMMMRRSIFDQVGGFTERLTVAFNDVDLCLKVRKTGYRIIYDPYVTGCHYESKSRGMEDSEEKVRRFQTEIEYMRTQWEDILKGGDPYYNPNLTEYRSDYSLRFVRKNRRNGVDGF